VTPEEQALRRLVELFEAHRIPYMFTGSVASSHHGRPRATHDADVVIDPTGSQLESLVSALVSAGFYVNTDAVRRAFDQRRQFNAIEMQHACKIDLVFLKDRPFSRTEFGRRQSVDLPFGRQVAIVSPEDSILSKLEWARRSGESERQLRDAAGVVELNPSIDIEYIEHWARELDVLDLWRRLLVR